MSVETKRPARVLVVGSNQRSIDIAEKIKKDASSHFVGFADDVNFSANDLRFVCKLDEIEEYVSKNHIDEVLITLPVRTFYEKNAALLSKCKENGIKVSVCGNIFNIPCTELDLSGSIKRHIQNIFFLKKKRVLIVGLNMRALSLAENIRQCERRCEFVGFADDTEISSVSVKCKISEIKTYILNHQIDEVIITLPVKSFYDQIVSIVETCQSSEISIKVLDDFFSDRKKIPRCIEKKKKIRTVDFQILHEGKNA
jgi:FlaA1/EpsC-like NDP-sugar epimerase